MTRFIFFIAFLALTSTATAEPVVITNNTSEILYTIWTREGKTGDYALRAKKVWSGGSVRINIDEMPFHVAVSKRDGSYSYIGPFDHDTPKGDGAKISITQKNVYENKTMTASVWCQAHQRWESTESVITVSKPIFEVRLKGLKEAREGATLLRNKESLKTPD